MKNLITLLILISFSFALMAQNADTTGTAANPDKSRPTKKDTTRIRLGNKGIAIMEDSTGTSVKITEINKNDENNETEVTVNDDSKANEGKESRKRSKFKGHWSGIDLGFNDFMNSDLTMTRKPGAEYMDLNTGRSWNVNLNVMQYSFGFGTDVIGLVTGLGFEFNDYHFDGNNSIMKDSVGNITSLDYTKLNISLDKSKLSTVYLTVPLLLEFQVPHGASHNKRFHVAAGVIGGLKLGSHTKVVYYANSKRQKDKVRDDFNINALRYGLTARVGYHGLNLYANYYPTPLFEKDKGPELNPFAVGLSLGF